MNVRGTRLTKLYLLYKIVWELTLHSDIHILQSLPSFLKEVI